MWWTVIGPIVMSTLLMRVSGVTLLEKTIITRRPPSNAGPPTMALKENKNTCKAYVSNIVFISES